MFKINIERYVKLLNSVTMTQEQQFLNDSEVAFEAVQDMFALDFSDDWSEREQYSIAAYYLLSSFRDQLLLRKRISEASYQLFRDLVYKI